jgi:3-phosphoshikimate 1-carboxyvinyltransferase
MALRGVTLSSFNLPLSMSGMLQPGDYVFAGDEGSQYISGALMALPILRGDSIIRLSSPLVDGTFIDVTLDTLENFGIRIDVDEEGFHVPGRQFYKSPGKAVVENDWALSTMWACAGCLSPEGEDPVIVDGLPARTVQMYRSFEEVMSLLRCDVKYLNVDAGETPNLACLYAVIAAAKGSALDLSGVPQLRYKETDRLKTVCECIRALGAKASPTEDGIRIEECSDFNYPEDVVLDCKGDPWIFMSIAIAAGCLPKPVILSDEHCAEKVYRHFLRDYEALGGKYEIL